MERVELPQQTSHIPCLVCRPQSTIQLVEEKNWDIVLFFDLPLPQGMTSLADDRAGVIRILRGKFANLEVEEEVEVDYYVNKLSS